MKIKTETIIRTIVLAAALINNILTMMDMNPLPFSDESIYEAVSAVVTVCASLWAWWENNSFTKAAIMADKEYDRIKASETTEENIDNESFR